ncbi:MAG: putative ArsR-family regulator [Acidimicrobiia bacterium]|jgi:DNA-binding transcriptional ArsR family regulator|nr:putative ArsR-family regulator [Acidimicrobiia bacterium]
MNWGDLDSGRGVGAKLFRGLADPTRLAILQVLGAGEYRVTDLVGVLRTSQSNVSAHLACLKDCGLVTDRPEGRAVYYRIATKEIYELLRAAEDLLEDVGDQIALCPNYETTGN